MISPLTKICKECRKEYVVRRNSLYCIPCSDKVRGRAYIEYLKRRKERLKTQDITDPGVRSKIARLGGIARAGKYQEGMSSITYEPPPVVCPECGSFRTVQAYGERYDCLECLYSFDYQEGL